MKNPAALVVLALVLCLPAAGALAQQAYATTPTELRAGPGPDYPVVAVVDAGQPVWVQGCVPDYSWCDVLAGAERGWIYAGYIQSYYDYQNGYVPLLYYGAVIGVAAYPFFLNDYWGRYYVNRPWYGQRFYWGHHHPSRVPPRPRPFSPVAGDRRPPPQHPQPIGAVPQHSQPSGVMPQHPRPTGVMPQQNPHPIGVVPWQPHSPGVTARPASVTNVAPAAARPSAAGTKPPGGARSPNSWDQGRGWHGPGVR